MAAGSKLELSELIVRLGEKLDRQGDMLARMDERQQHTSDQVASIDEAIHGNGQEGMKTKIARLERDGIELRQTMSETRGSLAGFTALVQRREVTDQATAVEREARHDRELVEAQGRSRLKERVIVAVIGGTATLGAAWFAGAFQR